MFSQETPSIDDALLLSLDSAPVSVIDQAHHIRAEAHLEQIVSTPLATERTARKKWVRRLRWAAIPVAAAGVGIVAIMWPGSPSLSPAHASLIVCDSGVNENGDTYGSSANAPTSDDEPDLICAENSAGLVGFIRTAELREAEGWNVSNPEEALEWNAYRNSHEAPLLTMYEKDGTTVIGTWDGVDWESDSIEYVSPLD